MSEAEWEAYEAGVEMGWALAFAHLNINPASAVTP